MFKQLLSVRPYLSIALCLFVASCTTMEADPVADPDQSGISILESVSDSVALSNASRAGDETDTEPSRSEPTLYRGTDELVRLPKPQKPVRFLGEDVSLNFEAAPLTEVVHAVMGDILELDYVVEHPIAGEVTLRTRTPVPRDELLDILESLLKANNALMIRDADGRYFVSGSGQMSRLKPSVAASASGVSGFSTVIIPLSVSVRRNN